MSVNAITALNSAQPGLPAGGLRATGLEEAWWRITWRSIFAEQFLTDYGASASPTAAGLRYRYDRLAPRNIS